MPEGVVVAGAGVVAVSVVVVPVGAVVVLAGGEGWTLGAGL